MRTLKTLLNNAAISREGKNYTLHFRPLEPDTAEKISNLLSQNNFEIVRKFGIYSITVQANSLYELREKLSKIDKPKDKISKKSHEIAVKTLDPSKAKKASNTRDIPFCMHEGIIIFQKAIKSFNVDQINKGLTAIKELINTFRSKVSREENELFSEYFSDLVKFNQHLENHKLYVKLFYESIDNIYKKAIESNDSEKINKAIDSLLNILKDSATKNSFHINYHIQELRKKSTQLETVKKGLDTL